MTAPAQCTGAVHKAPADGGSCPCGRVTRVQAAHPHPSTAQWLLDTFGSAGRPDDKGEQIVDGEPTAAQAATLVQHLMRAGAVARLDLVHGALVAAYRAGRAAEQAEVQRLAREHVDAFTAALTERAAEQANRAMLPWNLQ